MVEREEAKNGPKNRWRQHRNKQALEDQKKTPKGKKRGKETSKEVDKIAQRIEW